MKKLFVGILVLIMLLGVVGCASDTESTKGESEEPAVTYALGDTVETDILSFTLDRAELTIAVHNGAAGDFDQIGLPKEYDSSRDKSSLYVAATGHTLVAYTFIVENLDRTSLTLDAEHSTSFLTVKYEGESYDCGYQWAYSSSDGFDWSSYRSSTITLAPQKPEHFRRTADIPVEATSLTDTFSMTFHLPTSSGETADYTFVITAEDVAARNDREISLEDAINNFFNAESKKYFKNHMNEYSTLTGDEIEKLLSGKTCSVAGVFTYGNTIEFDAAGSSLDYYGTELEWSVSGNKLNMELGQHTSFKVAKINAANYLLIDGNEAVCVFYNIK